MLRPTIRKRAEGCQLLAARERHYVLEPVARGKRIIFAGKSHRCRQWGSQVPPEGSVCRLLNVSRRKEELKSVMLKSAAGGNDCWMSHVGRKSRNPSCWSLPLEGTITEYLPPAGRAKICLSSVEVCAEGKSPSWRKNVACVWSPSKRKRRELQRQPLQFSSRECF